MFYSLLWFLSSMVCAFPCRGHSHPLLSLLLGIDFFMLLELELFSYILSQSVHCWYIEMLCIERLLIFVS
jgi:hypothetical protein